MTQKLTIFALDHTKTVAHEILDGVSQRRCFPRLIDHTMHAEDDLGNLAITRAVGPAIYGLQHVARAAQLLAGQPGVWRNYTPKKRLKEASNSFGAIEAIGCDRYEGSQRRYSINTGKSHQMQRLPVAEIMEKMLASIVPLGGRRFEAGDQIAVRKKERWDISQDDNTAVLVRRPEDGSLCGSENGLDKEIAGPTDGVRSPRGFRNVLADVRLWNSHADNHRYAVTIPRQVRAP